MIARLFISPNLEDRIKEIEKILSAENFPPNHPDILYFPEDSKLGIEAAKQIKEHFFLKPYQLKGKVVVLEDASVLTVEAQNALLKTLEEPPENALLILGAPSEDKLLPTVVSRCQVVILDTSSVTLSEAKGIYSSPFDRYDKLTASKLRAQNDNYVTDIEKLINSTLEERFEYIEKLKERGEFLQSLIGYFRAQMLQLSYDPLRPRLSSTQARSEASRSTIVTAWELREFLKELIQAEEWAAQNVNIRAILEYLMLVMPFIRKQ